MNARAAVIQVVLACVAFACGGGSGYVDDLKHPSAERRVAAAEFLGAQREARAVPDLTHALRDTSAEVRAKAVWALGMIRSRESRVELERMLSDPNRRVRQSAAWSVMQLEEPEALSALRAALSTERDVWVKADLQRAVEYLEQFQGEEDVNESGFR